MKHSFIISFFLFSLKLTAQEPLLQVGSTFPDMIIRDISNGPAKEYYLNNAKDKKLYILNFWGTWCSPCLPEMDTLAKLQAGNAGKIQVIGISDDSETRKLNYLAKKPSEIWLATDTNYILYKMLNLSYVGQSAIINADKKIIALVRTDSINQSLIDKLLKGQPVKMSAELKEFRVKNDADNFGVDSLLEQSFTIRGYSKGMPGMIKTYLLDSFYSGRRISFFNASVSLLYRKAYGITSFGNEEFYDSTVNEQELQNHDNKNKGFLYSVDLLVKPEQKDSLYFFLRQYLNASLPFKARLEKRLIEVIVLKQIAGTTILLQPSTAAVSSYSFTGRGYNGAKVKLSDFASDYLSNELGFPVIDETGLKGFFDISTSVALRTAAGIRESIAKLGLEVKKAKREVEVIVYYK